MVDHLTLSRNSSGWHHCQNWTILISEKDKQEKKQHVYTYFERCYIPQYKILFDKVPDILILAPIFVDFVVGTLCIQNKHFHLIYLIMLYLLTLKEQLIFIWVAIKWNNPLLIFFTCEIKIALYWFLWSAWEYDSNEKYLEAWSGAHFYKNHQYV